MLRLLSTPLRSPSTSLSSSARFPRLTRYITTSPNLLHTSKAPLRPVPVSIVRTRKMATVVNGSALNGKLNGATTNGKHLESFGNFDLVKQVKLDFADILLSKWQSRVTGLSVVHLDYDAPIINGYFVVGTEIFDDTGCPHTLEHLVFMGSEQYPYKGILDHFANRGFSNGTNAWTDLDHTAYTIATAGEEGFLQLLPIYVDHILYPTLTKTGFVTEVHHINGEGQNSGVVYSEMQGRENTSGDLMSLRLQRLLYPPGSAYRSETGGLMEALRVLTIDQIRDYHHKYYVPHNLSLVVCGKLASGTPSLLDVIQKKVEPTIIRHGQDKGPRPQGWLRPFLETPSAHREPLKTTIKETVEFPEKDESMGEVHIAFTGPPPHAFLERKALDILATYLTSSPVAPLNKEFVEIESPLCTYIYFGEDVRASLVDLPIYTGSVPTEHLDTFDEKLQASLQRIVKEGMDMKRMAMVIDRDERQLRSKIESSKGDTFSGTVIDDFLYGARDGSDLAPALDELKQYNALRSWTSKQWTDILRKYYVDPHRVVVKGRPSAEMVEKLERDEKERIEEQKKRLGPKGLKAAENELEEAKKEHDKEIPPKIISSFPVPDVKSISWIPVQSLQEIGKGRSLKRPLWNDGNEKLAQHIQSDGEPVPFFVQYDHVQSDFTTIHAYFSLANLPNRLRPYMSTYTSALFSLPVTRSNGERLSHEEVVNRLDNDTVSYEVALGMSSSFNEVMRVTIKVETAMYETAIAWLKDLIHGAQFDQERLAVNIAKILQSLPEMKRDGDTVLSSITAGLLFDERSTSLAGSVIAQSEFMPTLAKQLQEDPAKVIADFEDLRKHIAEPSGVRFSVTGNVLDLKEPRTAWKRHFEQYLPPTELLPINFASDTLSPVGENPVKKAVVVSLPTIESSFVTHTTKGPQGFDHPDYPAVRVAAEALNATESFLWRYIRGSGLAYGANVSVDLEAGFTSFTLYRSSNNMEAFRQAAGVIKDLVDGKIALEDTTMDAAKSSIVYGVTKTVSTPGRAALASFTNQAFKGVPQDHSVRLLEKFKAVTKQDVLHTLKKYFLPLFDSSSSIAVVVTAPSKAEDTGKQLAAIGYDVEQRTLEVEPDEDNEFSDSDGSDSEMDTDDSR